MKEATGDLNMTVVIAMIVAALASFFYFVIWPKIGETQSTVCQRAVCDKSTLNKKQKGYVECTATDDDGNELNEKVLCQYKG